MKQTHDSDFSLNVFAESVLLTYIRQVLKIAFTDNMKTSLVLTRVMKNEWNNEQFGF